MMESKVDSYKAVTLIEIVLITALLGIMALAGASSLFNYYRTSVMDIELRQVTARLQRTRQQAISNDSSSDYSVKFLTAKYVVFKGSTYTEGAPDNVEYALSTNVLVSTSYSNNIVTFGHFTGRTGNSGSITVAAFGFTKVITINSLGIVQSIS